MDSNSLNYFPVLKTKDAELRAISNLDNYVSESILPVFELTKSRITKKNVIGDIAKRVQEIAKIQVKRPFILDVTTDNKQTNSQTAALLNPMAGYRNWQAFLAAYADLNIIPMIHINFELDATLSETSNFVRASSLNYKTLALRLPPDLAEEDYSEIFDAITPYLGHAKLDVLLDARCIRSFAKKNGIRPIVSQFIESSDCVHMLADGRDWLRNVVCIAGSFPLIVSKEGGDEKGDFEIFEQSLWTALRGIRPHLKFGDYASINAEQVEIGGGTFVPRIDFCTNDRFFYHRFRRHEGSYAKCAKKVISDSNYRSLNSWGDDEIFTAATATPTGISPSFWISARANRYMTNRAKLYGAK
ncbi:hypothetical protein ACBG90_19935 [Stutzerimonas kunmingensis]|uniref:beta family protein n=1 Tax=Stutzerimonas kunmingensis TaxID=1211807 RepID=UPI0035241064